MATVINVVQREEFDRLKAELAELKMHLGALLPRPNVPVIEYNPGPHPTETTTVGPPGHPDWIKPRRRTPDGGYDDAA